MFTCRPKDQVENEIHFILECPLYAALREKYDIVQYMSNSLHVKCLWSNFLNNRPFKKLDL